MSEPTKIDCNMKNKGIEFENCIIKTAFESGLNLGEVIYALSKVKHKFEKAGENLTNATDICKVLDYLEHT